MKRIRVFFFLRIILATFVLLLGVCYHKSLNLRAVAIRKRCKLCGKCGVLRRLRATVHCRY